MNINHIDPYERIGPRSQFRDRMVLVRGNAVGSKVSGLVRTGQLNRTKWKASRQETECRRQKTGHRLQKAGTRIQTKKVPKGN